MAIKIYFLKDFIRNISWIYISNDLLVRKQDSKSRAPLDFTIFILQKQSLVDFSYVTLLISGYSCIIPIHLITHSLEFIVLPPKIRKF